MAEKTGCYKESSRADKCIDRLCELNGNEDVRIEGGKKTPQGQWRERESFAESVLKTGGIDWGEWVQLVKVYLYVCARACCL